MSMPCVMLVQTDVKKQAVNTVALLFQLPAELLLVQKGSCSV